MTHLLNSCKNCSDKVDNDLQKNNLVAITEADVEIKAELAESPAIKTDFAAKNHAITEQKKAAAALCQSEEFNRQILESSDDCIKVLDLEGHILFMSRGGQALLGIQDITPFLHTSWAEFWKGTDKQAAIAAIAKARAGEVGSFLGYRPTLNGLPKWWDNKMSPIRRADGQVERLLCISRDITERVRAESALRQSEARLRALISASSNVLYRMNADWSEMQELQGRDFIAHTSEPVRDWLQKYIHPDDQARVQRKIDAAIQNKSLFELEHRVRRVDGTLGWTYSRAVPLLDSTGEIIEWFGEASDISDRKRMEANLTFLTEIMADFAPLKTAAEIMRKTCAKTVAHLDLSRCLLVKINDAMDEAEVIYDFGADHLPSLVGTYPLADFHTESEVQELAAGRALVINDVAAQPRAAEAADRFTRLQIGALVNAPYVSDGQWKFVLCAMQKQPRAWCGDEIELLRELSARIWLRIERAHAEAVVAADLQDTQLLRELGARLVTEGDIQTLYQEIMSTAIALQRADAGTVQILDEATQELVLLATQGIPQTMVDHFYRVKASSNTSCGIALKNGERSFVDFDVPDSKDPNGAMRMHVETGYLSGQSTPLITRSGKPIGMVSTHWREHHRPTERELRFLDLLARQAADLIEQRHTIAEQEKLLAREQAARAEADRANRIKDEFLAVLSHELRSPLNPILGWSSLLQTRKLDEAKTAQALSTIQRNAKLQSELIDDLLDVSRILRGKLSLNENPVDLATTIRGAMETVRLAASAKSINVQAELEPNIGFVLGDSTRLQQVVWNLLSNAVKFTPPGGQVKVQLSVVSQLEAEGAEEDKGDKEDIFPTHQSQIPIQNPKSSSVAARSAIQNSYAQITVSDTGQGINPDFLPYVFDYFRQENAATTRKFGGLGLGLAIVRHLVELHGGTVAAESSGEGQGATFIVKLPLIPAQITLHSRSLDEGSLDLSSIKILVVDDETDTRDFTAFLLEQSGAQVMAVSSAAEALVALRQSKFDLLLSDIGMPDVDGYILIQQVRMLLPPNNQIPAIALTAYAGEMNQQQALNAGFQKHISKPIEPEVLLQSISSLVGINL